VAVAASDVMWRTVVLCEMKKRYVTIVWSLWLKQSHCDSDYWLWETAGCVYHVLCVVVVQAAAVALWPAQAQQPICGMAGWQPESLWPWQALALQRLWRLCSLQLAGSWTLYQPQLVKMTFCGWRNGCGWSLAGWRGVSK